jgi:hypothetical protein
MLVNIESNAQNVKKMMNVWLGVCIAFVATGNCYSASRQQRQQQPDHNVDIDTASNIITDELGCDATSELQALLE